MGWLYVAGDTIILEEEASNRFCKGGINRVWRRAPRHG